MGKKSGGGASMPSPSEYIPLVNAQAQANRINTYNPYSSTVFSQVPGVPAAGGAPNQQATAYSGEVGRGGTPPPPSTPFGAPSTGGGKASLMARQRQAQPGITPMQSVTSFSPELQRIFQRQTSMAGTPASNANFNDEIEQATFKRAMNMLEPGLQQQSRDFQQSMADRGLPSGGAAYDNEFANIQRAQNSARENAALSAVLAGNDAALRGRGMNLSERGNQFNEMSAILGQAQGTPTAPVDVMGPANMALNRSMANQQNQQAKKSSGVNAGTALGAAYLLSDSRVKENAVVIGEFIPGINIYKANYIGNSETMICLMADEVEKIFPEAVITLDDGFKRVNYGYLMAGRELNG